MRYVYMDFIEKTPEEFNFQRKSVWFFIGGDHHQSIDKVQLVHPLLPDERPSNCNIQRNMVQHRCNRNLLPLHNVLKISVLQS